MDHIRRLLPILTWAPRYQRGDLRGDLAAGLTVGAMLVPQAMAYALLAGLPPEVGLYAATIPVIVYAVFGTSRQLAVGPVAIVSLLTATALAEVAEEGSASYLEAAALLAVMVGVIHLVMGVGRLGFLVNFLSHSVLVGFTAAAAIIIGLSQVKHILGVSIPRSEQVLETLRELAEVIGDTDATTLAIGLGSVVALFALKRWMPLVPGALVVVIVTTVMVAALDLDVSTVGEIPGGLPAFGLPDVDLGLIGDLAVTAFVITIVGFMESIAVAKVYARRNRYDVEPNAELVGLGAANVAAGVVGGYPITGGFSRTAVNATAGARTPLASIVTAGIVLATIAFLTPLFEDLPNAALGAIIVVAVVGLVDVKEMRHIAAVKRSDLIGLGVAFVATLALGIELGIAVAVIASMLVVFARMSMPHSAVLGRLPGTSTWRNLDRFPEAVTAEGVRVVRIDAALSFVNATNVKKLVVDQAAAVAAGAAPRALVLDASGINDIDATGVEMVHDVLREVADLDVELHLGDVKGPVRDVLRRAGIWQELGERIHATTEEAVRTLVGETASPSDRRGAGIDEREGSPADPAPSDDDGTSVPGQRAGDDPPADPTSSTTTTTSTMEGAR